MKTYQLKKKISYESFVKAYKNMKDNNLEAEAFLGESPEYRFSQRDSQNAALTDMQVLMEYCLFPLYVEGDTDIERRTSAILYNFASSRDIKKLWQVSEYLWIQEYILDEYRLPFYVDVERLLSRLLESLSQVSEEDKKAGYYASIINHVKSVTEIDRIECGEFSALAREYEEKYKKKPKLVQSVAEVWPVELDVQTIDAIGIVDGYLEFLLVDTNRWIQDLEIDHLTKLQEKINNYLYYIETKQYVERYGDDFETIFIHLTFQYYVSETGLQFLAAVSEQLKKTNIRLKIEMPE